MSRLTRLFPFVLALAVTLGLGLAGVGADAGTPRVASAAAASVPLPHDDPFYAYTGSTPLTNIAPGTVLNTRAVTVGVPGSGSGVLPATQLLYRTQDERKKPSVTVTTVVNPAGPLATGVVGYLSFYDALGDICDPSYTLRGGDPGQSNTELADTEAGLVSTLAAEGYAVTVPDFEGEDLHWVAGQESGWSSLDAIRATESYLGMASTTKVGLFGYSGGSIAGEWAAELAPRYSPDLNIVGTAVGGLPVDLAHNLKYVDGSQDWSGVMPAVLVGLGRAFGVNMRKYESAYGKTITKTVRNQCIGSFNGNYPGLTVAKLVKPRYRHLLRVPAFARIVNKLIMGSAPGHPISPLFLGVGNADGTGDHVMIAKDVEALGHEYCSQGVTVQFTEYPGSEHTQAGLQFFPAAESYLAQRFLGLPPTNGCASIGPGNSLKPLKIRHKHHHHHHHR